MRSYNQSGFTFIELLVSLVITGFVAIAVYKSFEKQQTAYVMEDQIVEIQQSIRAARDVVTKEIWMAGYDPTKQASAGIINAFPDLIYFSKDLNADGILDQYVAFDYYVSNGITKAGFIISSNPITIQYLGGGHYEAVGHQPLVENIEGLGFAYAFDLDGDGHADRSPGGNIIWAIDTDGDNNLDTILDTNDDGIIDTNDTSGGASLGTTVSISRVRAVKVWLLVRTSSSDNKFIDTNTYVLANQRITPNNNFRHRLAVFTVQCRNLGLD